MTATTHLPHPSATVPTTRTLRDDLATVPTLLTSERIKLTSLRSNRAVLGLTVLVAAFSSWAVATLVTDEVLTVAKVFVYPTTLTAVFSAIAGILMFTSEAQHGTLATALTAQPARWVIAMCKAITASAVGVLLGVVGMAAGFAGALAGGLEMGDASTIATTALWALLFTTLSALMGLGIGMTARHGAASISGFLVWWFVIENLLGVFAPARAARFLPFVTGYRLLGIGSDFDSAEAIAVALTRGQNAVVYTAYTVVALAVGTVLLQRRESN
ncbi:MAG: ABC transporter permease subunit [Actinomycetota bacterium]|nr:ABC transporter permease subunit [Actinomycetota bacterium]